MKYRLIFYGRRLNALGISGFQCVDLEAASEAEARRKVYDTHEHITGGLDGIQVIPAPIKKGTKP